MSEPVSNVDIEDVLSSIRRLVGDENRPLPKPEPAAEPYKPTRLVLTPSLLVSEPGLDDLRDESEDESGDLSGDDFRNDSLGDDALPSDPEPDATAETGETTDVSVVELPFKSPAEQPDGDDPDPDRLNSDDPDPESLEDVIPDAENLNTDIPDPENPDSDGLDAESPDSESPEPENHRPENPDPAPEDVVQSALESGPDSNNDPWPDPSDIEPDADTAQDTSPTPWINPEATLYEAAESVENEAPDQTADPVDAVVEDDGALASADETPPDADNPDDQPETSRLEGDEEPEHNAPDQPDQPDVAASPDSAVVADQSEEDAPDTDPPATDPRDSPPDMAADDLAEAQGDPHNTATLSAKIAVLEAQIGRTSDQWEPDGELGDDYAGTQVETIAWQDHHDAGAAEPEAPEHPDQEVHVAEPPVAEPLAEPVMAAANDDDSDTLDLMEDDDAILDEESLRELVAEIVRQELQGALGERITRNVRKLVRREIHRALTAQELD